MHAYCIFVGMAVAERRKDSFLTYISDATQQVGCLVEAGYFYSCGKYICLYLLSQIQQVG